MIQRLIVVCFLSVALPYRVFAEAEPTHFRKAHRLLIEARAGKPVTIVLTAISASTGYSDALTYRLFGPDGKSAAKGRMAPGGKKIIAFTAKTDGVLALEADPGMNAFSAGVRGGACVADISETRQLNVIGHARPLYFYVPGGAPSELDFVFNGEKAHVHLLRPDGSVAFDRALAQYKTVKASATVGTGRNGWWRMELTLAEDQGIRFPQGVLPFIAEAKLPETFMHMLTTGGHWVNFDFRPTPRTQLTAKPGTVKWAVETKDGLELGFTKNGRLISLKLDGAELAGGRGALLAGFFVRDVATDSDVLVPHGDMKKTGKGLSVEYDVPGANLSMAAEFQSGADSVTVDVVVTNHAGSDRAVTVYFALPFPLGPVKWWDDILTARAATANLTYGAFGRAAAGANGRHSLYPFGCVTGKQGLALAVPMDHPLFHRFAACPASRQFFLAIDLGLTRATVKSPNRAAYRFRIFRCDPRWGLRSVAKRYYSLFPRFFEKRMPEDGGWVCWGSCAGMTNLRELGFKYHWGPGGASAVAFDDTHGLYSFLYNDSMRFFADLGKFNRRPTRKEAAAAMRRLLDAPDPRACVLAAPKSATGRGRYLSREKRMGRAAAEKWLRDATAAVGKSAGLDGNGDIQIGYIINRKDWGGKDWWTGRCFCNIDPDIPGGYGQFLFQRVLTPTVERTRKEGGELDGFGLDNFFVNAKSLDFSKAHMAYTDYPVCFAADDFRPVLLGDTIMYEWTRELKRRLERKGKWLIANTCRQAFPFAQHLLDINGIEWGLRTEAAIARTLAYHKQVVSLPVKPAHYEEPFIKAHLAMAVFPGGYGGDKRFVPGTPTAQLYAKYVPIIKRMAAAGWEPVPWATAAAPAVGIERFGSHLPLLFSVHNRRATPCQTRITIELAPLRAASSQSVRDIVRGADLATTVHEGKLSFSVSLEASDLTVVELR